MKAKIGYEGPHCAWADDGGKRTNDVVVRINSTSAEHDLIVCSEGEKRRVKRGEKQAAGRCRRRRMCSADGEAYDRRGCARSRSPGPAPEPSHFAQLTTYQL